MTLTPWDEITGCNWYDRMPDYHLHTKHLPLESDGLSPTEVAAVTAVVGRFVPVYDSKGRLLAEPKSSPAVAATSGSASIDGWKSQFTLQSLLLLTVVVSCAASCYGIHYRRARPQRQALAKFDQFHPHVYGMGGNVTSVDFSAGTLKPGDDDLTPLEGLEHLESVDLDGAPVTDAGLRHLYPLKKLKRMALSGTKVTRKGVDDLKRALPAVRVSWPSPPPPFVPPSAPPVAAPPADVPASGRK